MKSSVRRVVIVQQHLASYRVPFFALLAERLAREGVSLVVLAGDRPGGDLLARDVSPEWLRLSPLLRLWPRRLGMTWLRTRGLTRVADLVVVEGALRFVNVYGVLANPVRSRPRIALWGHGSNFQRLRPSLVVDGLRGWVGRRAWWWFAYNDLSRDVILRQGYPAERITSVQNAIDTRALRASRQAHEGEGFGRRYGALGIRGRHVCVYVGRMYAEKRIGFLVEACREIRRIDTEFEMVFIGDGPDAPVVRTACSEEGWLHYVGWQEPDDVAVWCADARLMLMPGLVGLAVLDSFALEVPMVTIACAAHGPEIEYIEDGINGRIVPGNPTSRDYAEVVLRLVGDEVGLATLKAGCRASAERLTIENMVERFAQGVLEALRP